MGASHSAAYMEGLLVVPVSRQRSSSSATSSPIKGLTHGLIWSSGASNRTVVENSRAAQTALQHGHQIEVVRRSERLRVGLDLADPDDAVRPDGAGFTREGQEVPPAVADEDAPRISPIWRSEP